MSHFTALTRKNVFTTLSVLALVAGLAGSAVVHFDMGLISPAYAASGADGHNGDGGNGGNGNGGNGSGGSGHNGSTGGQSGGGQGSPDDDSEGQGPRAGGGNARAGAGGPVWSNEGIPEVELGRLNVARSPDHVLERALAESLNELSDAAVDFYNLSVDEMVEELSLHFDDLSYIDSPLQNLALLDAYLEGETPLADAGVTNDLDTLLAVFLGTASDKTVEITDETVTAVTTILGDPITGHDADLLAEAAESIRIAILAGHG
ncbi:hypothetical protein [Celeribacter neptunius]|uniref:Uncharacterized protein n=1 Tax=Celeribacter neptunius TaxID=588602 RepID=A0A1I3KN53_9RHOB|nr:hypothetical protein [Celeribacter neptunius]SFI73922.1 hypothetical protein SAMN04487991_0745 [Celeribacter neptunius]